MVDWTDRLMRGLSTALDYARTRRRIESAAPPLGPRPGMIEDERWGGERGHAGGSSDGARWTVETSLITLSAAQPRRESQEISAARGTTS